MQDGSEVGLITKVVSHPTLPLTITAHEDRHIRFFDNKSGKQTHVMVAHLDAVTSLAIDTNGLYLISGSKYFCPFENQPKLKSAKFKSSGKLNVALFWLFLSVAIW